MPLIPMAVPNSCTKSFSRFRGGRHDVGLQYLADADINPEGLIGLLQILMDEQNKTIHGKAMNQLSGYHPSHR